jgi:hypothetical protein
MSDSVSQFRDLAPLLITEAAAYAARGEEIPEVSANIRELKVLTAALMAALQTIR